MQPEGLCAAGHFCTYGSCTPTPVEASGSAYDCTKAGGVCARGEGCSPGAVQPVPCAPGTYADAAGGECLPCPAGFLCEAVGTADVTVDMRCPAGSYCRAGSSAPAPCPAGTYGVDDGLADSSECVCAPPGSYAAKAGQTGVTDVCQRGHYCSGCSVTGEPNEVYGGEHGGECPAGTYCAVESAAPTPCPAGLYCAESRAHTPSGPCDAGYFCAIGSTSPREEPCPAGHFCPTGAVAPVPCAPGTLGLIEGLESETECAPCPAGFCCPDAGMANATRACDAGYYCPPGSSDCADAAFACPPGYFCEFGDPAAPQVCPAGTYTDAYGSVECAVCEPGSTCDGPALLLAMQEAEEEAAAEEAAARAADDAIEVLFPPPPAAGAEEPATRRSRGLLQAWAEHEGGAVPPLRIRRNCSAGFYCPASTGEMVACERGTFNPLEGSHSVVDCVPCTAGSYCDTNGLSAPTGPCEGGFYCVGGARKPKPKTLDEGGARCTVGHYCPIGSSEPVPCGPGTYADAEGMAECNPSPGGYYVAATGSSSLYADEGAEDGDGDAVSSGPCLAGYYCNGGCRTPTPEAGSSDGGPCPRHHRCPEGTHVPKACPPGSYQDREGQTKCNVCPEGYACPGNGVFEPCPAGHWCPSGSSIGEPCLAGTFNPNNASRDADACIPCTAGAYCQGFGLAAPSGPCDGGYFCNAGSDTPRPEEGSSAGGVCAAGTYCPCTLYETPEPVCEPVCQSPGGAGADADSNAAADSGNATDCGEYALECATPEPSVCVRGASEPVSCKAGHYCATRALAAPTGACSEAFYCEAGATVGSPSGADETGGPCELGHDCPAGTCDELGTSCPPPCPRGSVAVAPGVCELAPAGYYSDQLAALEVAGPCDEGFFCPAGSTSPAAPEHVCPIGHRCPAAAPAPLPCNAGTYQPNEGRAGCLVCPAGSFCDLGATEPVVCPAGHACDEGTPSARAFPCPAGTFSNVTGLESLGGCLPCPPGRHCNVTALLAPTGLCAGGYFCALGSPTPTPTTELYPALTGVDVGGVCPAGFECPPGSVAPTATPCPPHKFCGSGTAYGEYCMAGTYAEWNTTQLTSQADCMECPPGLYCREGRNYHYEAPGSSTERVLNLCAAGFVCAGSSPTPTPNASYAFGTTGDTASWPVPGGVCPRGHFCAAGTAAGGEVACREWQFNPYEGARDASSCLTCNPGKSCEGPGANGTAAYAQQPCPAGHYCPRGSESDPKTWHAVPCPAGTFSESEGASSEDVCAPCVAGFFCPAPATVNAALYPCPPGAYCPPGATAPLPCEPGTYRALPEGVYAYGLDLESPELIEDTGGKPAGRQPQGASLLEYTAGRCDVCSKGFYCDAQADADASSAASATAQLWGAVSQRPCLDGFACGWATAQPEPCGAGYYCVNQTDAPVLCPPSFYCPSAAEPPVPCPRGAYCPPGSQEYSLCPSGSWQPASVTPAMRGDILSACEPVPDGHFSSVELHQGAAYDACDAGYLCGYVNIFGVQDRSLFAGLYFGATTPTPRGVGNGTKTYPDGGRECPAGHYCESGDVLALPCPAGTFNPAPRGASLADCLPCEANFYNRRVGQTTCLRCGSSSSTEGLAGQATCTCLGGNRTMLSDGSCICMPGHQFYNPVSQLRVDGDSDGDCQRIVYNRCTGSTVLDADGNCAQLGDGSAICAKQCASGSGRYMENLGYCECDGGVAFTEEVCDRVCQANQLQLTIQSDGSYAQYDPLTGETTTIESDPLSTISRTTCAEGAACSVVPVVSDPDSGPSGLLDAPGDYFASSIGGGGDGQSALRALLAARSGVRASAAAAAGRRLLQDDGSLPGDQPLIPTPIVCLELYDAIAWDLSADPTNYPVYAKDSRINDNPDFDYGDFLELGRRQEQGDSQVNLFAFTFSQSGMYVFYDSKAEDKKMVVSVQAEGTSCPEGEARILPRTESNSLRTGIAQNKDIITQPDWVLISLVLTGFFLIISALLACGHFWNRSSWGVRESRGARYRGDAKARLLSSELMSLQQGGTGELKSDPASFGDDETLETLDLEDFSVKTLYDKLEDQTLHVASQIAHQTDVIRQALASAIGPEVAASLAGLAMEGDGADGAALGQLTLSQDVARREALEGAAGSGEEGAGAGGPAILLESTGDSVVDAISEMNSRLLDIQATQTMELNMDDDTRAGVLALKQQKLAEAAALELDLKQERERVEMAREEVLDARAQVAELIHEASSGAPLQASLPAEAAAVRIELSQEEQGQLQALFDAEQRMLREAGDAPLGALANVALEQHRARVDAERKRLLEAGATPAEMLAWEAQQEAGMAQIVAKLGLAQHQEAKRLAGVALLQGDEGGALDQGDALVVALSQGMEDIARAGQAEATIAQDMQAQLVDVKRRLAAFDDTVGAMVRQLAAAGGSPAEIAAAVKLAQAELQGEKATASMALVALSSEAGRLAEEIDAAERAGRPDDEIAGLRAKQADQLRAMKERLAAERERQRLRLRERLAAIKADRDARPFDRSVRVDEALDTAAGEFRKAVVEQERAVLVTETPVSGLDAVDAAEVRRQQEARLRRLDSALESDQARQRSLLEQRLARRKAARSAASLVREGAAPEEVAVAADAERCAAAADDALAAFAESAVAQEEARLKVSADAAAAAGGMNADALEALKMEHARKLEEMRAALAEEHENRLESLQRRYHIATASGDASRQKVEELTTKLEEYAAAAAAEGMRAMEGLAGAEGGGDALMQAECERLAVDLEQRLDKRSGEAAKALEGGASGEALLQGARALLAEDAADAALNEAANRAIAADQATFEAELAIREASGDAAAVAALKGARAAHEVKLREVLTAERERQRAALRGRIKAAEAMRAASEQRSGDLASVEDIMSGAVSAADREAARMVDGESAEGAAASENETQLAVMREAINGNLQRLAGGATAGGSAADAVLELADAMAAEAIAGAEGAIAATARRLSGASAADGGGDVDDEAKRVLRKASMQLDAVDADLAAEKERRRRSLEARLARRKAQKAKVDVSQAQSMEGAVADSLAAGASPEAVAEAVRGVLMADEAEDALGTAAAAASAVRSVGVPAARKLHAALAFEQAAQMRALEASLAAARASPVATSLQARVKTAIADALEDAGLAALVVEAEHVIAAEAETADAQLVAMYGALEQWRDSLRAELSALVDANAAACAAPGEDDALSFASEVRAKVDNAARKAARSALASRPFELAHAEGDSEAMSAAASAAAGARVVACIALLEGKEEPDVGQSLKASLMAQPAVEQAARSIDAVSAVTLRVEREQARAAMLARGDGEHAFQVERLVALERALAAERDRQLCIVAARVRARGSAGTGGSVAAAIDGVVERAEASLDREHAAVLQEREAKAAAAAEAAATPAEAEALKKQHAEQKARIVQAMASDRDRQRAMLRAKLEAQRQAKANAAVAAAAGAAGAEGVEGEAAVEGRLIADEAEVALADEAKALADQLAAAANLTEEQARQLREKHAAQLATKREEVDAAKEAKRAELEARLAARSLQSASEADSMAASPVPGGIETVLTQLDAVHGAERESLAAELDLAARDAMLQLERTAEADHVAAMVALRARHTSALAAAEHDGASEADIDALQREMETELEATRARLEGESASMAAAEREERVAYRRRRLELLGQKHALERERVKAAIAHDAEGVKTAMDKEREVDEAVVAAEVALEDEAERVDSLKAKMEAKASARRLAVEAKEHAARARAQLVADPEPMLLELKIVHGLELEALELELKLLAADRLEAANKLFTRDRDRLEQEAARIEQQMLMASSGSEATAENEDVATNRARVRTLLAEMEADNAKQREELSVRLEAKAQARIAKMQGRHVEEVTRFESGQGEAVEVKLAVSDKLAGLIASEKKLRAAAAYRKEVAIGARTKLAEAIKAATAVGGGVREQGVVDGLIATVYDSEAAATSAASEKQINSTLVSLLSIVEEGATVLRPVAAAAERAGAAFDAELSAALKGAVQGVQANIARQCEEIETRVLAKKAALLEASAARVDAARAAHAARLRADNLAEAARKAAKGGGDASSLMDEALGALAEAHVKELGRLSEEGAEAAARSAVDTISVFMMERTSAWHTTRAAAAARTAAMRDAAGVTGALGALGVQLDAHFAELREGDLAAEEAAAAALARVSESRRECLEANQANEMERLRLAAQRETDAAALRALQERERVAMQAQLDCEDAAAMSKAESEASAEEKMQVALQSAKGGVLAAVSESSGVLADEVAAIRAAKEAELHKMHDALAADREAKREALRARLKAKRQRKMQVADKKQEAEMAALEAESSGADAAAVARAEAAKAAATTLEFQTELAQAEEDAEEAMDKGMGEVMRLNGGVAEAHAARAASVGELADIRALLLSQQREFEQWREQMRKAHETQLTAVRAELSARLGVQAAPAGEETPSAAAAAVPVAPAAVEVLSLSPAQLAARHESEHVALKASLDREEAVEEQALRERHAASAAEALNAERARAADELRALQEASPGGEVSSEELAALRERQAEELRGMQAVLDEDLTAELSAARAPLEARRAKRLALQAERHATERAEQEQAERSGAALEAVAADHQRESAALERRLQDEASADADAASNVINSRQEGLAKAREALARVQAGGTAGDLAGDSEQQAQKVALLVQFEQDVARQQAALATEAQRQDALLERKLRARRAKRDQLRRRQAAEATERKATERETVALAAEATTRSGRRESVAAGAHAMAAAAAKAHAEREAAARPVGGGALSGVAARALQASSVARLEAREDALVARIVDQLAAKLLPQLLEAAAKNTVGVATVASPATEIAGASAGEVAPAVAGTVEAAKPTAMERARARAAERAAARARGETVTSAISAATKSDGGSLSPEDAQAQQMQRQMAEILAQGQQEQQALVAATNAERERQEKMLQEQLAKRRAARQAASQAGAAKSPESEM